MVSMRKLFKKIVWRVLCFGRKRIKGKGAEGAEGTEKKKEDGACKTKTGVLLLPMK